jgi:hypothetical protein
MAQPQHLEVTELSEEEHHALLRAVPKIEALVSHHGGVFEVNSDALMLRETCAPFMALFGAWRTLVMSQIDLAHLN